MKMAKVGEENSRVLLAARSAKRKASLAQLAERSLRRKTSFASGRGTEIETLTRHSFFFLFCLVANERGRGKEEKGGDARVREKERSVWKERAVDSFDRDFPQSFFLSFLSLLPRALSFTCFFSRSLLASGPCILHLPCRPKTLENQLHAVPCTDDGAESLRCESGRRAAP